MNIVVSTTVKNDIDTIWNGFDQTLFLKLAPPFPPVKLLRFDGCKTKDIVSLELNFLLFKQEWTSEIIDSVRTEEENYFIDKGTKLPFFLKTWYHKHRIVRTTCGAEIVDDVYFSSGYILIDWLLFPVLYLQFAYRIPIYKKIFNQK
jgi:ligand-binding SRPBCC domain-containing protein